MREKPKITTKDVLKFLPVRATRIFRPGNRNASGLPLAHGCAPFSQVGLCAAGAHSGSVFALGAGAVSFAQIVKSAEPAFAAVIGTLVYGSKISLAKWLCLVPVIGGVTLASVKELDFAWSALFTAAIANCFAAFKGQENKKLMATDGLKDRIGCVGNQFALTTIFAFLFTIPLAVWREGSRFAEFKEIFQTNPVVKLNLIASGLWFYGYNELATMTLKKTGAVTQSVANTAKRVIVIVGVAIILGESKHDPPHSRIARLWFAMPCPCVS